MPFHHPCSPLAHLLLNEVLLHQWAGHAALVQHPGGHGQRVGINTSKGPYDFGQELDATLSGGRSASKEHEREGRVQR